MKRSSLLSSVCVSLLAATASITVQADGIYKWTDNKGMVNYADTVPSHIKAQKLDDRILVKSRREDRDASSGNPEKEMTAGGKIDPNKLPATSAGLPE